MTTATVMNHRADLGRGPTAGTGNDSLAGKKTPVRKSTQSKPTRTGRWTQEEKLLFLYGLSKYGRGRWKKIGTLLPTRSLIQIKSHAQKVMKRYEAGENVFAALEENRAYFDFLVLPSAQQNNKVLGLMAGERTPIRRSVPKKGVLSPHALNVKSHEGRQLKVSSPRSASPNSSRRSVFQATLGNGNLSFSFKARRSLQGQLHKESKSPRVPASPGSLALTDSSRGGAASIAAAALCQLSTLGRKDQAVAVSP